MPSGPGRAQIKPSVSEESKRYLEQAAESDACSMGEVIDRLLELRKERTLEEVTMPLVRVEARFDRIEAMLKQLEVMLKQLLARYEEHYNTVEVLDGTEARSISTEAAYISQRMIRMLEEMPSRVRATMQPKPQPPAPRWNRHVWRRLGLVIAVLTMSGAHLTFIGAYFLHVWSPHAYFTWAGLSVVSLSVALGEEMLRGRTE